MRKKRAGGRPEPIDLEIVAASVMADRGQEGDRWYWRARRRDTRSTVWTGWATRAEAVAVLGALVSRGLPISPRSDREAARTAADLCEVWSAHQEKRQKAGEIAERSLVNYRQSARYWKDAIGDALTRELTRELVEDTATEWRASGISARTVKLACDVMAAMVKWGSTRGHCPKLDLRKMAAASVDHDEFVNCSKTPTAAEVAAVVRAMPDDQLAAVVHLLAVCGARIGEVAALRVRDYDTATGILVLKGADEERRRRGKVKARRFPLPPEGRRLVGRYVDGRGPDEPLFADLNRDVSDQVRRRLMEACEAAEVERFTAHGLRRMVAMQLLEHNDAKTVSELTGHSVATLLRFYVRPTAVALERAVVRSGLGIEDVDNVIEIPSRK